MTGISSKLGSSSVTRAIRLLGDRWSILVIRDAFQGVRRFEQFLARSGASRATLTRRLNSLVRNGILERIQYSTAPVRYEYRLTRKGRELFPLSVVAWNWERRWAPRGSGVPLKLRHLDCGQDVEAEFVCGHCGDAFTLRDVANEARPESAARAQPRTTRSRRLSALTGATHRGTHSPMTHIADIVGDPWTPLVLAAAFLGIRRFDAFQRELGIATNVLADRLDLLVRRKVLQRRQYLRLPPRYEYRLTDKGRDLFYYAVVLNAWGDKWLASPSGPPFRLVHTTCQHEIVPLVRCSRCQGTIVPGALTPVDSGRNMVGREVTAA